MACKLVVLAAALLQVGVSTPVASSVDTETMGVLERNQPRVGIYGGQNITVEKANYVGAILNQLGELQGTAIILNNRWILTSAGTVRLFHSFQLSVRVGSTYSATGGQLFAVKQKFVPSKYRGNWDYDIALLKLKTALKFSGTVGSTRVSTSNLPKEGNIGVISGYGYTENSTSGFLRQASVPISNHETCKSKLPSIFSSLSFCSLKDGAGPCGEDYGSPLIYEKKVVGVYFENYGYGCGKSSTPAVFADISKYSKWIESTITRNTEASEILEHSDEKSNL